MGISLQEASSSDTISSNADGISWNHTCTGTNRVLIVSTHQFEGTAGDEAVTGAWYNGTPLTIATNGAAVSSNYHIHTMYLFNPETGGSYVVAVSYQGINSKSLGRSVTYVGVDSLETIFAGEADVDGATGISVPVTVSSGSLIHDDANLEGSSSSVDAGSNQTLIWSNASGIGTGAQGASNQGPVASAGTYNQVWTWSSIRSIIVCGVGLKPVEAGTGPPIVAVALDTSFTFTGF